MIITLKKADFSSKNIGTLSTWSITKNLTGVTTIDNITSVDRGSSYSAEFTVSEGYVYSSHNLTIGGVQDNSCVSLAEDNRTVYVNIAASELTGNVVITIIAEKETEEEPVNKLSTPVIEIVEV